MQQYGCSMGRARLGTGTHGPASGLGPHWSKEPSRTSVRIWDLGQLIRCSIALYSVNLLFRARLCVAASALLQVVTKALLPIRVSSVPRETLFKNGGVSGWRGHGPPPPRPPTSPTTGSLSRWSPRGIIAEAARGRTPHFDLVPSGIPPQSCLMAAPLRRGAHWRPLVQGADLFWPRLVA